MRASPLSSSRVLASLLVLAASSAACGNPEVPRDPLGPAASSGSAGGGETTSAVTVGPGGGAEPPLEDVILESIRIEPEDATLVVDAPAQATLPFRVLARIAQVEGEVDITENAVFWTPEGHLVGAFDGDTFETDPVSPRAGMVTVEALAQGTDGEVSAVQTSLRVEIRARLRDPRDDGSPGYAVPDDVEDLFENAEPDATDGPILVYPSDRTMLPPNVAGLEVHWRPENGAYYEIAFTNEERGVDVRWYAACGPDEARFNAGCVLPLDRDGYRYVAESMRGEGSVTLRVREIDDDGDLVWTSGEAELSFAKEDVEGGLYYWTTTDPSGDPSGRIMRVDFGWESQAPEAFIVPGQGPLPDEGTTCVGCHAISRDGTKLVASIGGGFGEGPMVLVNDLSRAPDDPAFFTRPGDASIPLRFASWSPEGDRFVSVFADVEDEAAQRTLHVHDGDTGERLPAESITLPFEPSHPDWALDDSLIAMTQVGEHHTSQNPRKGGIAVLPRDGAGWSDPVTLIAPEDGVSRFNPSVAPDASFLVYSEAQCPPGEPWSCDADDDPTATTWAIVPEVGATPIHLGRAGSPGPEDGPTLFDTFPRFSLFASEHEGRPLYWVTMSSRRREGLRNADDQWQQLWMFAVDPEAVLAGEDGSWAPFWLPFQDLETSNHIAQWTAEVVTDDPPPDQPPPPPPPPPPPN